LREGLTHGLRFDDQAGDGLKPSRRTFTQTLQQLFSAKDSV
jgi:hypothetical protein